MAGRRVIGLSSRQAVPPLLSAIRKPTESKSMRDVDDDAPPLSSSDSSDDERFSNRADIRPSQFLKARRPRSPSGPDLNGGEASRDSETVSLHWKKTRALGRLASPGKPGSGHHDTNRDSEVEEIDNTPEPLAAKNLKRRPARDEESGDQIPDEIFFGSKKAATKRTYRGAKKFIAGFGQVKPPAKKFKPPPKALTPETGSPERVRAFRMPALPAAGGEPESPDRDFKAVPGIGPATLSPLRKKRRERRKRESSELSLDFDSPEDSQRPVFRMPEGLPESFVVDEHDELDSAVLPTANTSPSTSPLTDLDFLDDAPTCPLCSKEVDKAHLDEFKATHPRMTVRQMQKFCQEHKRRSARTAWLERGYPDIEWHKLDARIAKRYDFLRKILEGKQSHYGDLFKVRVRSGKERALYQSNQNLTPGYYGIRGLRAMSENLIREFSSLLRQRALQDKLVSARGHTAYLQSVLVPELAVQLIMEDMSVGEDEARRILTESSWVGELLNDEIADVVLEDSDGNS
ncbi:hypothetical protein VTK56DRAFT_2492 [Thermocarpiscus australiensis]